MKRLISALLATAMLISALPTLVFADEENNFMENAVETTAEEMPGLGSEATIGNVVFYIEDGTLFRSENNARPKTVDENVSWIIEDNNKFYWSKLEEHSTSSIYFCSAKDTTGEVLTKLFVPVEAFDIDGNDLYYLYNGEIVKLNLETKKEENVAINKKIKSFYLNKDNSIQFILNKETKLETEISIPSTNTTNNNIDIELFRTKYNKEKAVEYIENSSMINANLKKEFISLINACPPSDGKKFMVDNSTLKNIAIQSGKDLEGKYTGSLYNSEGTCVGCFQFATFAYAWLFNIIGKSGYSNSVTQGYNIQSKTTNELYGKGKYKGEVNATLFDNYDVVPGAHIRTSTHSMILVDYDNSYLTLYHGNGTGNNDIVFETLTWDEFYEKQLGGKGRCITYIVYPDSTHYHKVCTSFKSIGICKECGATYDWKNPFDETCSGLYVIKPNKSKIKTELRELPYESSTLIAKGVSAEYEVVGSVTNAYKNKWYAVGYGDYENGNFVQKMGYVYAPSIDNNYTRTSYAQYPEIKKLFNANISNSTSKTVSSGGSVKPSSTNSSKTNSIVQSNVNVNLTSMPNEIYVGQSYPLRGTITSSYPMYYISGTIIDSSGNSVIPWIDFRGNGAKYIGITQNHVLNTKMTFNSIKNPGEYKIRIIVNCNSNGSQENLKVFDFPFTVKSENQCEMPTINVSNIEEGQQVTFNCNSGGTIHYSVDNGTEQSCISGTTINYTSVGTYNISAYVTRTNYNQSPVKQKTVNVSKADTPIIGNVKYGVNNAWVTISGNGNIYYTQNGSNPNKKSSSYGGTIYLYDSTTIKAISTQYGKVNSDVASKTLTVSAPDTPSGLKLYNTKEKIAQGKTATFSWNSANRATSYEATLYYNGEQVGKPYETKGTTAAFKLTEAGVYTVKVKAKNFKGASAESSAVSVESMAPVTVKFVDRILREGKVTDEVVNQIQQNVNAHYGEEAKEIEGNVISVQKIDYDTKPNVPTWDDKEGFSRQYFEGIDKNITEDTTIYAYYKVKDYNVQFWNYWTYDSENNTQIGETQNILYSYSAKAPTEMNVPTGYTLAGWNVDAKSECYDFTFVNGNMKLYTSYTWENKDLPVIMEFVSAKRGNTCQSYDITLKYINNNLTDTQARIIMSLYTADGRMVYTATEDVDLMARDPGIYYTETIQATYPNRISKISAVMVQVKNDKTGGAVSKMISTTDIDMPNDGTTWTAWSAWSTTNPGTEPARYNDVKGNTREVESKTQYRARSKQYTTSNNTKSLSGWNYSYTDTYPGNWIDNGTAWVGAENSDYRKREVSSTWHTNYKTQWLYSRYVYNGKVQPYQSASYTYYEDTGWRDYALPFEHYVNFARGTYASYNPYWSWQAINDGIATRDRNWYNEQTRTVENGGYYTYKYKDTYYTHHFWKWNSWSDWSDKSVSGDETQKRTVYRWRDNFNNYPGYDPNRDSTLEEETIKTYEISGNISGLTTDYNGKLATVLVYKETNSDPTQEQLEYVDQITIGENNSYSFTVNPKEEISYEDTGDYIVTLSLEGSRNLANVDVIKAPVPQCKVTFQNDDGSILKDENGEDLVKYVDKNGSLDVNEITIPTKEGYRFVKWDRSLINIDKDMTVAPLYEKEVYNVVYVDYENQTADMLEVSYGDPINLPEVEEVEGKEFIGWDAECYKYATEGNVDTDIFNIKEEAPYYLTTDGTYILVSDYNSEEHNIVDQTEYYKYFSEKNTIITENKIVTAKWKTNEYTVRFCDFDGNIVEGDLGKQTVKYGESAILPDFVEKDGVLYSWDLTGEEWWNVTKDMIITPYIPQEVQVDAPTISAPTTDAFGEYTAELEVNGENMKIYYTLDCTITESDARKFVAMLNETDGTEDEETAETEISLMSDESDDEPTEVDGSDETDININDYIEEYTEPISLYAGNVVYAFTVDKDGNISPVSVFQYDYNVTDETFGDASNEYVPDSDVPQITMATINAKPGETVSVPVKIKNNMGITNLSMILGYNAEDLTLLTAENGDVFAENEFSQDIREDGSCKFVWECENDNFNDGTLMNLTFKVKDSAEKAKYMLDLRVEYSGDENDEEWYFVTVPGALTDEENLNGTLGDINEDGDVDFSDAIVILKYDAGLKDIDESKLPLGDVNEDGDVDFSDAILIIKFDAGLISEFKKNN